MSVAKMDYKYYCVEFIYIAIIFIYLCTTAVHPVPIYPKQESSADCFSPDVTLDELKAAASANVPCSENNERAFWVAACHCSTAIANGLSGSLCPKCRVLRNTDGILSSNDDFRPVVASFAGPSAKFTTDENELVGRKFRVSPNITSTVSNPSNFIRFGK